VSAALSISGSRPLASATQTNFLSDRSNPSRSGSEGNSARSVSSARAIRLSATAPNPSAGAPPDSGSLSLPGALWALASPYVAATSSRPVDNRIALFRPWTAAPAEPAHTARDSPGSTGPSARTRRPGRVDPLELGMGVSGSAAQCGSLTVLDQTRKLMLAAASGDGARLDELLRTGLSVNAQDPQGATPLVWAARRQQWATVRLLLQKGANPDLASASASSPLSAAIGAATDDHLALDLTRVFVDAGAKKLDEPLFTAASCGFLKTAEFLLDRGANPNTRLRFAGTPLCRAIVAGNLDVVRLLLQRGADVDAGVDYIDLTRHTGLSPLDLALEKGDTAVVKELLDRDAQISAITWGLARESGNSELVRLLEGISAKRALPGECAADSQRDTTAGN
jgi:ankyrin repeat protein